MSTLIILVDKSNLKSCQHFQSLLAAIDLHINHLLANLTKPTKIVNNSKSDSYR